MYYTYKIYYVMIIFIRLEECDTIYNVVCKVYGK